MFATERGAAHPLGITVYPHGVNFSLFSQAATEVILLLFDRVDAVEPSQIDPLDPFRQQDVSFLARVRQRLRSGDVLRVSRRRARPIRRPGTGSIPTKC